MDITATRSLKKRTLMSRQEKGISCSHVCPAKFFFFFSYFVLIPGSAYSTLNPVSCYYCMLVHTTEYIHTVVLRLLRQMLYLHIRDNAS